MARISARQSDRVQSDMARISARPFEQRMAGRSSDNDVGLFRFGIDRLDTAYISQWQRPSHYDSGAPPTYHYIVPRRNLYRRFFPLRFGIDRMDT